MKKNHKSEDAYKTIGEIAKELNLIDKKTGQSQTHTLRYWETQFKQIKPSIRAGSRRYYSKKDFEMIKFIKVLLKERSLTINGVKQILNKNKNQSIDLNNDLGINKPNLERVEFIKNKAIKISKIIKDINKIK